MEILPYVHVQKIISAKKFFKCKRYSVQWRTNWFWPKYCKKNLFSGVISYGAPNEPEAYLEPSRTYAMDLFLQK